jgi:hypothetical protein
MRWKESAQISTPTSSNSCALADAAQALTSNRTHDPWAGSPDARVPPH